MPDFSQLTDRQREIYDFIKDKIETRGYGPTVREIGLALRHPVAQRRDVPSEGPGKEGADHARGLLGAGDPAGRSSPAGRRDCRCWATSPPARRSRRSRSDERLDFNDLFGGPDHFALKVRGQSMIEDHIDDGDLRRHPQAGDGRERRARGGHDRQRGDAEALSTATRDTSAWSRPTAPCSRSSSMRPIADAQILGVLVGVLRKC